MVQHEPKDRFFVGNDGKNGLFVSGKPAAVPKVSKKLLKQPKYLFKRRFYTFLIKKRAQIVAKSRNI